MTGTADASWGGDWVDARPGDAPQAATRPPRPRPGPVFIGDCATQWGGRPMLLLLDEALHGEGL